MIRGGKVAVVGAGRVGGTLAQRLAELGIAEIVLIDIVEGLAAGKALDLAHAGPIAGYDTAVTGSTDLGAAAGSDVVVITSGMPRRPGMSRDDLVLTNAAIVASVAAEVGTHCPDAVLIMVSNPLDVMAQLALAVTGHPRTRVLGMAGVLDSARFRSLLAAELGTSSADVHAPVLGGHGDDMVPLTRLATVAGVPVTDLVPAARLDEIVARVRAAGADIVSLLKTSSAFQAPSAAAAEMVDAIVHDRRRVLPCSVLLEGEYGIRGLFTGVPCRLGAGGLAGIVETPLDDGERAALHRSASAVRDLLEIVNRRRDEVMPDLPRLGTGVSTGTN